MAKTKVYDTSGKSIGQTELPEEIFNAKINESLVAQAVRVYLGNQRRARAKAKTRGEVRGSTRKIYRQKGTGRARHGDKYAPIFVGGGKAHGPTGLENFALKLPRKMRRRALFSALTSKLKNKEVVVVDGLAKVKPKTKEMIKITQNLKLKTQNHNLKLKTSIILPEKLENVMRAARNIANLDLLQAGQLNAYRVLNGGRLLLMKESLKKMREVYLK